MTLDASLSAWGRAVQPQLHRALPLLAWQPGGAPDRSVCQLKNGQYRCHPSGEALPSYCPCLPARQSGCDTRVSIPALTQGAGGGGGATRWKQLLWDLVPFAPFARHCHLLC